MVYGVRSNTGVCLVSISVLCATTVPSLLRSAALNAGTVLQVRDVQTLTKLLCGKRCQTSSVPLKLAANVR